MIDDYRKQMLPGVHTILCTNIPFRPRPSLFRVIILSTVNS